MNVTESCYLRIGGIDQWVQIRGRDATNPLLLWLSGGPGASTIPYTAAYDNWERYFTLVMWDQRGSGQTFARYGSSIEDTMTLERMAGDGIELAEHLRVRFSGSSIVLLAHSWGSILGIRMILRRPDLFSAYVGTGQVTRLLHQLEGAYPLLLEHAVVLRREKARKELLAAGPPSEGNIRAYGIANRWAVQFEMSDWSMPYTSGPTEHAANSVTEPSYVADGHKFSTRVLTREMVTIDLLETATCFSIPIFLFQGTQDLLTITSSVRAYFDALTAPRKTFVPIRGAGHLAVFTARERFLARLLSDVRPIAVR